MSDCQVLELEHSYTWAMYIGLVVVWPSLAPMVWWLKPGTCDPEIESQRLHASFSLTSILYHHIQHYNNVLLHRAMEILYTSNGENILQQFHVISDSKFMSWQNSVRKSTFWLKFTLALTCDFATESSQRACISSFKHIVLQAMKSCWVVA